jgi:uncharacterized glyoxalase superfamily protein PhnB
MSATEPAEGVSERPEESWPVVVPMPTYEDVGAASDWLCQAFGFTELQRFQDGEGNVTTAVLTVPGGGALLLGRTGPDYQSPRRHRETCDASRLWQQVPYIVDGVMVTVQDVDAHLAMARAAGAGVLSDPEDTPHGRQYRVEDPEGHRWMFSGPSRNSDG